MSGVSPLVALTTTVSATDASRSVNTDTVAPASETTTAPLVAGENPTRVAVTRYVPDGTLVNRYEPSTPDVVSPRVGPPLNCTVAPGTPRPAWSTIIPVTCAF